jgi:hypothetical protein
MSSLGFYTDYHNAQHDRLLDEETLTNIVLSNQRQQHDKPACTCSLREVVMPEMVPITR